MQVQFADQGGVAAEGRAWVAKGAESRIHEVYAAAGGALAAPPAAVVDMQHAKLRCSCIIPPQAVHAIEWNLTCSSF